MEPPLKLAVMIGFNLGALVNPIKPHPVHTVSFVFCFFSYHLDYNFVTLTQSRINRGMTHITQLADVAMITLSPI